jgi:5-methylcytosine-specific restriction endonuclease McrBC regulatory subunit McrC
MDVYKNGIQAIEWTVYERGLAGISEMKGIPWILPLDSFFESWIETLITQLPKRIGGVAYFGRKKETVSPIHWDNAYIGTQKSLIPDAVLECDETTYIFDAKYKRHWEEFNSSNWFQIEKEIQEQHRQDLLQVLAYSTLKTNKRVVSCLIYPCQNQTWESLKSRGQLFRHGSIPANDRNIEIILTAVPMNARIEETVDNLQLALRSEIH